MAHVCIRNCKWQARTQTPTTIKRIHRPEEMVRYCIALFTRAIADNLVHRSHHRANDSPGFDLSICQEVVHTLAIISLQLLDNAQNLRLEQEF